MLPLLPWLPLGAAAGLFTAHFEQVLIGAQGADFDLNLVQRCLLAGRVVWFYLGHLLWPADLMFIYPRWTISAADAGQWLALVAALASLAALVAWSRRQRGPLAAALFFVGTLFPVLGFVNVYPFIFSYVADHFQYLASLGFFALAGAGLTLVTDSLPRAARWAGSGILLAGLAALTWSQSGIYHDVFTLYETTLRQNPTCWMAHHNLALALTEAGRVEEAVFHLEAALNIKPDYAPSVNNLGDNLLQLGRTAEAIPSQSRLRSRLHRPDRGGPAPLRARRATPAGLRRGGVQLGCRLAALASVRRGGAAF